MTVTTKLKLMLFLEYGMLSVFTINSFFFINHLGLSGTQAGILLSLFGAGMLVGSFVTTKLTQSLVTEERLLGFYLAIAAFSFIGISLAESFNELLVLFGINAVAVAPTMGLTNSITFKHLDNESHFGKVRAWGTIGFVVFAWVISILAFNSGDESPAMAYRWASVLSIVMMAFTRYLPRTSKSVSELEITSSSFSLTTFLSSPVVLLLIFIDITALLFQKGFFLAFGPNLSALGFTSQWIMPTTVLNQTIEIFALFALTSLVLRFSRFTIIFAGLFIHAVAFLLISFQLPLFAILAVCLYGFIYPFILATTQMVLDSKTTKNNRPAMHQAYLFLTIGIADLVGNWVAGFLFDYFNIASGSFTLWWQFLAVGSALVFVISLTIKLTLGGFREAQYS